MNKQSPHKSSTWAQAWMLALVGLSLSGCASKAPTSNIGADNPLISVEIHDRKGVLQGHPAIGVPLRAVPICQSGKCTSEFNYQWYVITEKGPEPILGASGVTFTPTNKDRDSQVVVQLRTK